MKTTVGNVIVVLILFAGGWLFGRVAAVQQQLATAKVDLATLQPESADGVYADITDSLGMAGRLPFIGASLAAEITRERTLVAYWRGDYASVPSEESDLMERGADAALVFLAANARFRSVVGQRRGAEGVQDLDAVLRLYTMGMKLDPTFVDGAYDYEYVVRLRNVLARSTDKRDSAADNAGSEIEPPPSPHGEQGAPPEETPAEEFNVIVPLRPEERGELMKAGASAGRQRKG